MLNWWDRLVLRANRRGADWNLGRQGEQVASRFLRRKGMKIVAHSMRNALGEIDLVAVDRRTVVFVEVKTRSSNIAGEPGEAVDHNKQRRMTGAALAFLKSHRLLENPARFDVVTLIWSPEESIPQIEHIENAFEAAGPQFQMFS